MADPAAPPISHPADADSENYPQDISRHGLLPGSMAAVVRATQAAMRAALALAVIALAACADPAVDRSAEGVDAAGDAQSATGAYGERPDGDTAPAAEAAGEQAGTRGGTTGTGDAQQQRLPEDFPASIPLPDPYEVFASATGSAAKINVTLHTPVLFEDLVELYDHDLPERGWEIEHRRQAGFGEARSILYGISRDEASGILQLIDDPEQRELRVVQIGIGS